MILRRFASVAAFVALTWIAGEVHADVVLTSATRTLSTFAGVQVLPSDPGEFETNEVFEHGFNFYENGITTDVTLAGNSMVTQGRQTSSLSNHVMTFEGDFSAVPDLSAGGVFAEGFGVSSANIHFTVTFSTPFRVLGTMAATGNGQATLSLIRNETQTIFQDFFMDATLPIDYDVTLSPGNYSLFVQVGGYGNESSLGRTVSDGLFTLTANFGSSTSVEGVTVEPMPLTLAPNPVRDHAVLSFGRPLSGNSAVRIFDVSGRLVRDLGRPTETSVMWDARGDNGSLLPAGIYFVRVGDNLQTRATLVR